MFVVCEESSTSFTFLESDMSSQRYLDVASMIPILYTLHRTGPLNIREEKRLNLIIRDGVGEVKEEQVFLAKAQY